MLKKWIIIGLLLMALNDLYGYKALWYDTGVVVDGSKRNYPYRLLYPYGYDDNPTNDGQGYPLMIYVGGSGEVGINNIDMMSWSIAEEWGIHGYQPGQEIYERCKMFVLIPHVIWYNNYYDDYCLNKGYEYKEGLKYSIHGYNTRYDLNENIIIKDIVDSLTNKTMVFYDSNDCSTTATKGSVLTNRYVADCNINSNKIYMSGSSMGGIFTFNMMFLFPDFLAAAIPCAINFNHVAIHSSIYSTYNQIYNQESDDYKELAKMIISNEMYNIQHIPTFHMVGNADNAGRGHQDENYLRKLISTEYNIPNNYYFIKVAGIGHSNQVLYNGFSQSSKIDLTNYNVQDYGSVGVNLFDYILTLNKPVRNFEIVDTSIISLDELLALDNKEAFCCYNIPEKYIIIDNAYLAGSYIYLWENYRRYYKNNRIFKKINNTIRVKDKSIYFLRKV